MTYSTPAISYMDGVQESLFEVHLSISFLLLYNILSQLPVENFKKNIKIEGHFPTWIPHRSASVLKRHDLGVWYIFLILLIQKQIKCDNS